MTRQAIIKGAKSMYDAVNAKTKIKLAVISDEYVADTEHCGILQEFWQEHSKWLNREDILDYFVHDIVQSVNPPAVVSNRGTFSIPDLHFV